MEAGSVVFINSIVPVALDDSNYVIWSSCMKDYLLSQDLWDVIEEIGNSSNNITKNGWRRKNASALHAIKMSCSTKFLSQVVKVESAKEAWDLLAAEANQQANGLDSEIEVANLTAQNGIDYEPFVKATQDGEWSRMEEFIDSHPQALIAKVFHEGRTALHYTLFEEQFQNAEKLVDRMTSSDLETKDDNDLTPLAYAAGQHGSDVLKTLKLMAEKNPQLTTNIGDHCMWIPILIASRGGIKDTTRFLYDTMDKSIFVGSDVGVHLLINCIDMKMFDIASDLVKNDPKILLHSSNDLGIYPIRAFAQTFSAFARGGGHKKSSRISKIFSAFARGGRHKKSNVVEMSDEQLIRDQEKIHDQAFAFLQLVCAEVSTFDTKILKEEAVYDGMIEAAIHGNIEFITEMLAANPKLIHAEKEGKHMFLYAIENRREKVFNLIYGITEKKDFYLRHLNKGGKSMLDYAAMLPQSAILHRNSANPILQMQREMMWFKQTRNLTPPYDREIENSDGLKLRQCFDKSHRQLNEAAEKLLREVAQSYTVVGALITTIMFAAPFAMPGFDELEQSHPNSFIPPSYFYAYFIVFDTISFFFSTISILSFLEILASRYKEDFLLHISKKIERGCQFLTQSIFSMMMAFYFGLYIQVGGQISSHMLIPVIAPIFMYLISWPQITFILKYGKITALSSFFDINTKLPTQKTYNKVCGRDEGELVRNGDDGIV